MTQITTLPIPGRVAARNATTAYADPPPRWRVSQFVLGEENQLVRQVADAWLRDLCPEYSPWVIVGPSGVGKSHLSAGLAARIGSRHPEPDKQSRIAIVTGKSWNRLYTTANHRRQLTSFRARFGRAALLVVDGLDDLAHAPAAQLELAHTLDAVHQEGGRVIVTCCEKPHAARHFSPRLLSRLESGLTCRLAAPEIETRVALIQAFSAAMQLHVTKLAARQLAADLSGSVVEIISALEEMSATRSLVDESLCDTFRQRAHHTQPTLAEILAATASHFGLSTAELRSASRKSQLVHARRIVIHLARTLTPASLQAIGAALGGRDHTTILYQSRKMLQIVQQDPHAVQSLHSIQQRLASRREQGASDG